jgi:radical SAM superfamily enzyme YgiQ (UPF0313 family)
VNILLVNPAYPDNFWTFKPLLGIVSKKSLQTPLGLIAVAALLPKTWNQKLVDLNIQPLRSEHLLWADYVFITGMIAQKNAIPPLLARCRQAGVKIVAGGPLFTLAPDHYPEADHLILFEAETNIPPFLRDLASGTPRRCYDSQKRPDLATVPAPRWDLIRLRDYVSVSIEQSRGCPFQCEFCDVRFFLGQGYRVKSRAQVVAELETLYQLGWRGDVTFVDDNFIGNRQHVKAEILPGMVAWMQQRQYPFTFTTSVTINLADDPEAMALLSRAGFETLFIGIESPADSSLRECAKKQNQARDLRENLQCLMHHGFQVRASFIVGFDQDPSSIFEEQILFIQTSGIGFPLVSMLAAPRGTALFERLEKENRVRPEFEENSGYYSTNFEPKMGLTRLLRGYKQIVDTIYSPASTFQRLGVFFAHYRPPRMKPVRFHWHDLRVIARCLWVLGIRDPGRIYFWKLLGRHWKNNQTLPVALGLWMMGLSVRGYHERQKITPVSSSGV